MTFQFLACSPTSTFSRHTFVVLLAFFVKKLTEYCKNMEALKNEPCDQLPYDWEKILKLLKKVYEGKIQDVKGNNDDNIVMNWFFCEAMPVVASDWVPHKHWNQKNYLENVNTSDEVMALWLLKHHPKRRQSVQEIKVKKEEDQETTERMSYEKLEDSIAWFNKTAGDLATFKKQIFENMQDDDKKTRANEMHDYVKHHFRKKAEAGNASKNGCGSDYGSPSDQSQPSTEGIDDDVMFVDDNFLCKSLCHAVRSINATETWIC